MKIQISADPFLILTLKGLVFMEMRISVMEIHWIPFLKFISLDYC